MNSFEALPLFSYDHALTLVLNNVWACLAVLSAAGAVRFLFNTNKSSPEKPASSNSDSNQKPHPCCQDLSEEPVSKTASFPAVDCRDDEMITRGKFVEYYYSTYSYEEVEMDRENVVFDDEGESEVEEVVHGGLDFRGREMRMGWYRYQDLTVFSGNVVRLWDDRLIY